jgi:hypothetical protein
VGPGKLFSHSGLVHSGDRPEFIWVLGAGDGVEYKDENGYAADGGVSAKTRVGTTGAFTPTTIGWSDNKNSYLQVP